MRKPSLAFVALAALVGALSSPSQARPRDGARDPEVWVTIGQAEAAALEDSLGRDGLASIVTLLEGNDVARLGRLRESRLGDLAAAMHARFKRCGGFTAHDTRAAALVALDAAERPPAPELVDYTIDNGPTVRGLIAPMAASNVQSTIQSLSSYSTRYYTSTTGVQAAQWLGNLWTSFATGYRPARTVLFMAYAAEEVGLRGSADIAAGFLTAKYRVIGKLQFDMTNYKGSSIDIGLLVELPPQTSHTNTAQNQFLSSLISAYAQDIVPGSGATQGSSGCNYACSDHASWNDRGFPSSIAFESLFSQYNPNIHTAADTLANSDPTAGHALKFSKLGAAYMAELAKGTIPSPLTEDSARGR